MFNEQEFINKLVKNIKKNYNLQDKYISNNIIDWQDDIIKSLNNAECTDRGNCLRYECMLDTRIHGKHITEYFTIEHSLINGNIYFRY